MIFTQRPTRRPEGAGRLLCVLDIGRIDRPSESHRGSQRSFWDGNLGNPFDAVREILVNVVMAKAAADLPIVNGQRVIVRNFELIAFVDARPLRQDERRRDVINIIVSRIRNSPHEWVLPVLEISSFLVFDAAVCTGEPIGQPSRRSILRPTIGRKSTSSIQNIP